MPTGIQYMRGHARLPNKDAVIQAKHRRHGFNLQALNNTAPAPPAKWDSRDKGWIPPIKDQGQCGSCWCFSGTDVCDVANAVAGKWPADGSKRLSEQCTLDCGRNGGCNGDDNVSVLDLAKKTGLPFASDYGTYQARAGRCNYKSSTPLNLIDDWVFVDANGGNGVTPTDMIKVAVMTFGIVGCAVAATSSWNNWPSDPNYVHKGNSNQIDHDVSIVGWDDDKKAWLMRNNWAKGWAWNGYGWIAYGADSIGTEAVAAVVRPVTPPPNPAVLWFA
jgi:C1A family cysteine protease